MVNASGESRISVSTPGHEHRIRCRAVRAGRRTLQPYARAASECRARDRAETIKLGDVSSPSPFSRELMKISQRQITPQITTARRSDDTTSNDEERHVKTRLLFVCVSGEDFSSTDVRFRQFLKEV
ncbi:hypothetical protein E1301_Tti019426 [Triplophysa tibetana]|uniref:Uncharacterized protein n=1 Tax=Triplophysa tibetana TaxID=1572043 RepID=A0A5A9NFD7_9TELE|nr:hypothetical protein E1301_Tti019426 [Triplophysa tibetana]